MLVCVYVGGEFVMATTANLALVAGIEGLGGLTYHSGSASFDNNKAPANWPARTNLAAFHVQTAALLPWAPSVNAPVHGLVVSGNQVFAGGSFTRVNGAVRQSFLAAFDATSGAVTPWAPEPDDLIHSLATDGQAISAGGIFKNSSFFRKRTGSWRRGILKA